MLCNSVMEEERVPVIAEGTTFAIDSKTRRKQRWYVGAFIAFNGVEETYKAALYNDKTPTEYPAVLKIVPHGDEPTPTDFQFYFDNADPKDSWTKVTKFKNVSLPVLLGIGNAEIKGIDYHYIIMKRYEKDVWSLFLKNGRKLNEHTVYKVGLRLLSTIHYIHSQVWIHNDIRGSNVMVDASENHIYLVNYHSATRYETSDEQINFNKANNVPVEYMSRDVHMGVSTMRGDIESLFYNLVQWLGVRLPWEKNLENVSLVQQQKNSAFTNVEQFLRECFQRREVPEPIRKFMNFIANMDPQSKPEYRNLKMVLRNGLLKLYHIPEGNLSFPLDNGSDDETMEGSSDVKQNKLRGGQKSKLGASVDQLAKIISKNFENEDEVDLQGEVVSGSLIHAIYQITRMRKSQEQQNKLANAWKKDLEGLRSKTKRLWSLKAQRRAASNTSTTSTTSVEEHEETSQGWHAPTAVSNSGLNHSTPSCSFSRAGTMNQNRTLEVPHPIDTNILPPNVHQTSQEARSASTSRSNPFQSPVFQTSSSGYSSRCSSRIGFHSEDLPLFRIPDPFLEKEHQSSKGVAVEFTEETGSTSESVDNDQWPKAYQRLNTWLNIKELVLSAFAPIPSEPSKTAEQLETVQFLLDEFRSGEPRAIYRQLMNVLANLPADSADARKLLQIRQRWQDKLDWLEGRGRELGEATLSRLRDALQGATSNLDKLLDHNPEEQLLYKLLIFAEQLKEQKTLLVSAGIVIAQLCQTFSDPVFKAKFRAELQSVNGLYDDLQRRVDVKKAEIEGSLEEEYEFDDSCKKMIVWLTKELEMWEKLVVSADPEKLRKHLEQYQSIMGQEAAVTELLRKGRDYPQNRKTVTQQSLLDLIKSQWERLRESSLQIFNKLKICTEHHNNYSQAQKLLESWLSEIEHKLGSLHPTALDEVEEALAKLLSLQTEIHGKTEEFERCTNLGETFINACDEDKEVVKDELIAMKDRWKKINNDVRERTQFLKDVADRFAVFNKSLTDLERRVGEMKLRDASRTKTQDIKPLGRIQKLREEADLLRGSPVKDVRQLAEELASKVVGHGMNTSRLSGEVDRVVADIESFLHKAYENLFASIEHDIKPTIIGQEQDVKPKIRLLTNNQLSDEIVDLVSDGEGEADHAIDKKPKLLPQLSEEPIDLASDNEADLAAT